MAWKVTFTGIKITPEEQKLIEKNMEEAIIYWSDTDCCYWAPTFRTAPYGKDGFWCDVFDIDTSEGTCRIDVFQRDEPMSGERLAHHLRALDALKALV